MIRPLHSYATTHFTMYYYYIHILIDKSTTYPHTPKHN